MPRNDRPRRRGFTLIELLVALTILTIIIAVIYATYASVVDSIQDTRELSATLRARHFIQNSLERNLAQASEGWSPGAAYRAFSQPVPSGESGGGAGRGIMRYPFLGARSTTPDGPADTLSFVSSTPLIGGSAIPGQMKLCTYKVTREEAEFGRGRGDEPKSLLTISETPWVDPGLGHEQTFSGPAQADELLHQAGERAGLKGGTVSVPIYAWELAYFDGKDWQDTWDSQQVGRLPWAVRVRVKVSGGEDDAFDSASKLDPTRDPAVIEFSVSVPLGVGVNDAPPDYARPTSREAT